MEINFIGANVTAYKPIAGVYRIDGIYIGASKNIRVRLRQHVLDALADRHTNKALQQHITARAELGIALQVQVLSPNPADEASFIDADIKAGVTLYNSISHGRPYRT